MSEIHTDSVTGIQFRATPDGWEESRGAVANGAWQMAYSRKYIEGSGDFMAIMFRVFGPPLPEKPRVVTLDGGRVYERRVGSATGGHYWQRIDSTGHIQNLAHEALDTLDRLQNGSDDVAG